MRVDLKKIKHVHFIGIKGVGMSALALILKGQGTMVTGSDVPTEFITDKNLRSAGITVTHGFNVENLKDKPDLVVTTPAWGKNNPEVAESVRLKLPVISGAALLGRLMDEQRGIVVTGTHGKTTTTAMLTFILKALGLDPSYFIGTGKIFGLEANGHFGKGEFFVAEGDEYKTACDGNRPKFMELRPELAILTSVELDHPDVFGSLIDVKRAFRDFTKNIRAGGFVAAYGDSRDVREVTADVPQARVEYYGLENINEWQATDLVFREQSTDFQVHCRGKLLGKFTTQLAGKHSVLNTLGVLALCHCLGLDLNKVRQALNDFIGSERRLELKGEIDGILVYDDYAHHPTAVTTTLDGLKRWYPDRQLWCVFQPHTFSRTRALLKDFANCFGPADHVLLTEIWGSARESAGDVSSRDIVALGAKHHPDMRFLPDQAAVKKVLLAEVAGPSVVVTMGAGDVYHLGESYLEECKIQNATASSGAPPKAVVKCKSGLSLRGRLRRPKQSRRWQ